MPVNKARVSATSRRCLRDLRWCEVKGVSVPIQAFDRPVRPRSNRHCTQHSTTRTAPATTSVLHAGVARACGHCETPRIYLHFVDESL